MNSIIVAFHRYTPFGVEYYEPIYNFFIKQMTKYRDEFDKLYLIVSDWKVKLPDFAEVLTIDSNLRYYEGYQKILPLLPDGNVLFLDNDMVIYREGIIKNIWEHLRDHDIVSIYDTCGTYTTNKLNGKNKFCPYLFSTRKELLMKYRDFNWGPNMPEWETLGLLTQMMLNDGIRPFEMEEDKSDIYFNGIRNPEKGKNLGYYHIRSGTTPAVLLAWKNSPEHNHTYQEYIKNQPKTEYLRQCAWYYYMCLQTQDSKNAFALIGILCDIFPEMKVMLKANQTTSEWHTYIEKFIQYHGI